MVSVVVVDLGSRGRSRGWTLLEQFLGSVPKEQYLVTEGRVGSDDGAHV